MRERERILKEIVSDVSWGWQHQTIEDKIGRCSHGEMAGIRIDGQSGQRRRDREHGIAGRSVYAHGSSTDMFRSVPIDGQSLQYPRTKQCEMR